LRRLLKVMACSFWAPLRLAYSRGGNGFRNTKPVDIHDLFSSLAQSAGLDVVGVDLYPKRKVAQNVEMGEVLWAALRDKDGLRALLKDLKEGDEAKVDTAVVLQNGVASGLGVITESLVEVFLDGAEDDVSWVLVGASGAIVVFVGRDVHDLGWGVDLEHSVLRHGFEQILCIESTGSTESQVWIGLKGSFSKGWLGQPPRGGGRWVGGGWVRHEPNLAPVYGPTSPDGS
jgi:hypothetical protein